MRISRTHIPFSSLILVPWSERQLLVFCDVVDRGLSMELMWCAKAIAPTDAHEGERRIRRKQVLVLTVYERVHDQGHVSDAIFEIVLAPWIQRDVPQCTRMPLIAFGYKRHGNVPRGGGAEETRHAVFAPNDVVEERSEFVTEATSSPDLSVGWEMHGFEGGTFDFTAHPQLIEVTANGDAVLDLLSDIISDHRVENGTQFHVIQQYFLSTHTPPPSPTSVNN